MALRKGLHLEAGGRMSRRTLLERFRQTRKSGCIGTRNHSRVGGFAHKAAGETGRSFIHKAAGGTASQLYNQSCMAGEEQLSHPRTLATWEVGLTQFWKLQGSGAP